MRQRLRFVTRPLPQRPRTWSWDLARRWRRTSGGHPTCTVPGRRQRFAKNAVVTISTIASTLTNAAASQLKDGHSATLASRNLEDAPPTSTRASFRGSGMKGTSHRLGNPMRPGAKSSREVSTLTVRMREIHRACQLVPTTGKKGQRQKSGDVSRHRCNAAAYTHQLRRKIPSGMVAALTTLTTRTIRHRHASLWKEKPAARPFSSEGIGPLDEAMDFEDTAATSGGGQRAAPTADLVTAAQRRKLLAAQHVEARRRRNEEEAVIKAAWGNGATALSVAAFVELRAMDAVPTVPIGAGHDVILCGGFTGCVRCGAVVGWHGHSRLETPCRGYCPAGSRRPIRLLARGMLPHRQQAHYGRDWPSGEERPTPFR